jgi:hypothetical protein
MVILAHITNHIKKSKEKKIIKIEKEKKLYNLFAIQN